MGSRTGGSQGSRRQWWAVSSWSRRRHCRGRRCRGGRGWGSLPDHWRRFPNRRSSHRSGDGPAGRELICCERDGWRERLHLSQKSTIALCDAAAAMDLDKVGVVRQHLNHLATLCPSARLVVVGLQVLQHHRVTAAQRRKHTRTMLEPLFHAAMPLGQSALSQVCFQPPFLSWLVASDKSREVVAQLAAKDDLGR